VLIDGTPHRVQELAPNQELTAYVHVTRPEIAIAPVADNEPVEAVPLAASDEPTRLSSAAPAPTMPETASPLEYVALLGMLGLALGMSLNIIRRRK
jgi:hypothetical protein